MLSALGLRSTLTCVAVLSATLFVGCGKAGPKLTQVQGKVTLDGEPLANKSLLFTPIEGTTGNGAGGVTDAEGRYSLKAMVPGAIKDYPGIGPGRYRVTVFEPIVTGDVTASESGEPAAAIAPSTNRKKSEIPSVYGTSRSPLVLDVPEEGGELDVALKSKPNA